MLGIYIHFPYCDVKCAYCDFYSLPKRRINSAFFEEYNSHLKHDLLQKKEFLPPKNKVHSIFFGGGTPSKLPPVYLKEIITFIYDSLEVSPHVEISLEANPESLKEENIQAYQSLGVNRLNVGIQTRNPSLLKYLGRIYQSTSYLEVLRKIRKSGFDNYGIDLIYGIPSQKINDIKDDIDWASSEGVKHISAYCLSVENSTLLEHQIKSLLKGRPSLRRQELHYEFVTDHLTKNDFHRYEISNFSKKGYECRHNLTYWKYRPYMGLGVSSHSFLGSHRFISGKSLNRYLRGEYFQVEEEKKIPEFFIGIFRILTYQSFNSIKKILTEDEFEIFYSALLKFQAKEWIKLADQGFHITGKGAKFSDSMISEAISLFDNNQVVFDYD